MKKLLLLIILLICVTGCTVDYKLTIDENNNFHENILLQTYNEEESNELKDDPWPINAYYDAPYASEYPTLIEGVEYYKLDTFKEKKYYKRTMEYNFPLQKFGNANSINQCYEHFYFMNNERKQTISLGTSSEFLCMINYPELTEVNITVELTQNVLSSNADKIEGNKYIWNINRDNYQNKGLILVYSSILEEPENDKEQSNYMYPIICVFVFIVFVIFFIIYYNKKQNEKRG